MQTVSGASSSYSRLNLPGALEFLGDNQGVLDLLPVLCTALSKDVPEVATLLAQGDVDEAAARLHSLKGFVPVFCFAPLSEELFRVERMSKGGGGRELTAAYAALAPELRQLGAEAAHLLSHLAPRP
jgi:hypothetical protein